MARFIFKLHGVLRQRELAERERQRELAVVQSKLAEHQRELRALDETVQGTTRDVRDNHLTGRLDLNFLAAHRRFLLATQRKAIEIAQRMALVQRQVAEAQQRLAEAAKQRKIIEKLREKQHARWLEDIQRKGMAELDDVGMKLSYAGLLEAEGMGDQ